MAVSTTIYCSAAFKENRFSAEYFDPQYKFIPRNNSNWMRIGQTLKKCQYGISISMNEDSRGYPIFRMNEIDNCFATKAVKYANISKKEFKDFRLNINDVLFNRTNSFEFVGRTGIMKDPTNSVFASYLIRVVPDPKILLPEYLTIYLNTVFGIGQIKRRAMPSINQANVSASELKRIQILIPSLSEQQKVSKFVNESFAKKRISQSIYTQAQKILEQELGLDKFKYEKPVGYETSFSEVMDGRRIDSQCYKPDHVNYEKYLRQNSDYDYLRLLVKSAVKGKQMPALPSGLINYVSIKDIQGLELISESFCNLSNDIRIAEKGSLLLAITGATIGKIGIVNRDDKLAFSGDLLGLEFKDVIDPHYLLTVMQSPIGQSQCNRWITGSTNGHLALKDVGKIVIPRLKKKKEKIIAEKIKGSLRTMQESEKLLIKAKTHVEDLVEAAVE